MGSTVLARAQDDVLSMVDDPVSLYLVGSISRGSGDEISDVDIVLFTHEREVPLNTEVLNENPELDLTLVSCEELQASGLEPYEQIKLREILYPLLNHGTRLHGADMEEAVEDAILLHGIDAFGGLMPWAFARRARRLREELVPTEVALPPDPSDEFLGYTATKPKLVVTLATWLGTAKVERRTHVRGISSKDEAAAELEGLDPDFATWLHHVISFCRDQLHYELPVDEDSRSVLREICEELHEREMEYAREF